MDKQELKRRAVEKIYESWIPGYSELSDSFKDSVGVEIVELIVEEAFSYWEVANCMSDFCFQSAGVGTIVFGSTNRLLWSYISGFRIDQSYCSPNFIALNG